MGVCWRICRFDGGECHDVNCPWCETNLHNPSKPQLKSQVALKLSTSYLQVNILAIWHLSQAHARLVHEKPYQGYHQMIEGGIQVDILWGRRELEITSGYLVNKDTSGYLVLEIGRIVYLIYMNTLILILSHVYCLNGSLMLLLLFRDLKFYSLSLMFVWKRALSLLAKDHRLEPPLWIEAWHLSRFLLSRTTDVMLYLGLNPGPCNT